MTADAHRLSALGAFKHEAEGRWRTRSRWPPRATRDGINGPVHTAFEQSKPNPRWNQIPFGSGK